jgi:hypothetical protein
LSNLALGSSRKAQSSVGRNLVQVASRFEVVWAVYLWPDVVFVMTGRVRSVLTNHCVVNWLTRRGPWEDRTRWSVWHMFQRVNSVIGRDCEVIDASGHVPVRSQADLTCPVIYDRTRSSVRSVSSKVLAWSDASGHPWSARPVISDRRIRSSLIGASGHSALAFGFWPLHSTGASGHVDQRVRLVWVLLIRQITVGFVCGVYKYIPSTSFRGLLLICSAEKHLWSVRECKSPSEDSDLRIKVCDSSLVIRV